MDFEVETFIAETAHAFDARQSDVIQYGDISGPLDTDGHTIGVAHALRGEGFDASEDGTGRAAPLVPVCFSAKDHGADASDDLAPTMRAMGHGESHANGGGQLAVAFAIQERAVSENPDAGPQGAGFQAECAYTLEARNKVQMVATRWAVRRLTPTECERLQGFPDGFTAIPLRGKPSDQCPDGPRYKALGNSMAVNVMAWIGARMDKELKRPVVSGLGAVGVVNG